MPLKAISAKSMCCTVVGPTRTLFPPPVPLPPLSFSSHDLGALVGMSGWPALWIQATRGRIYHPRPRIRAGGGCQPPSPRGVGSPVRSSPSYYKRVLVQATPGETDALGLDCSCGPTATKLHAMACPSHWASDGVWSPRPESGGAPVPPPTCIAHLSCTDSSAPSSTAYGGLAHRHSPTTDGLGLGPGAPSLHGGNQLPGQRDPQSKALRPDANTCYCKLLLV
jgi:hypothetical protein